MKDRMASSDRQPLLAAVAFLTLLGVSYAWVEFPPGIDEPGRAIVDWARTHRESIIQQAWLLMLAWLPGGALVALVHRRMTGAPAASFLLGGALLAGLTTLGALLRLGLARHASDLEPAIARVLGDLEVYWGPLATIGVVLQATSLAVATRAGAFSRWLLPISAVVALEQLLETLTIIGERGALAPGGAFNHVGAIFFFVWILAQGIAASGRPTPARPVLEPHDPSMGRVAVS